MDPSRRIVDRKDIALIGIRVAIDQIEAGVPDELEKTLRFFPIETLDVERSDRLLVTFLELCVELGRDHCMDIVVRRWIDSNPMEEKMPILTHLLTVTGIQDRVLAYVIRRYDSTFIEHLRYLIDSDSSPEVGTACVKLLAIYGEQSYEVYKEALEILDEQEAIATLSNSVVRNFISDRIREVSPVAEKPKWMLVGEETLVREPIMVKGIIPLSLEEVRELEESPLLELPSEEDFLYLLPSVNLTRVPRNIGTEEAVKLLTDGLDVVGLSLGDQELGKRAIREEYERATEGEKEDLLRPVLETIDRLKLVENKEIARILGPANTVVGADLTLDHVCYKYGGCRMFYCTEFENYDEIGGDILDEEGSDEIEWFEGSCDKCLKRIEKKWYAVRKPGVHGGWSGAYCSWSCVRKDIDQPNILLSQIITEFERKISETGVYDRD